MLIFTSLLLLQHHLCEQQPCLRAALGELLCSSRPQQTVPTARANNIFTSIRGVQGGSKMLSPDLLAVPNMGAHKILAHRELGDLGR